MKKYLIIGVLLALFNGVMTFCRDMIIFPQFGVYYDEIVYILFQVGLVVLFIMLLLKVTGLIRVRTGILLTIFLYGVVIYFSMLVGVIINLLTINAKS